MPTFYEGSPIVQASFTINQEDFIKAYYEKENNKSFLSRREVKGGIFLSLILLTILTIPKFYASFGTFFTPAVFILLFLILFYLFVFVQPNEIKKTAQRIYDTNAFLQLENKVSIYRDSLIYENQFEKYSQFLTDFDFCMESEDYFILIGGERSLFIIKKSVMEKRDIEKLSQSLSSFFTTRYIKIKVGYQ